MTATVVECDDFTFVGAPYNDRPIGYLVSLQFTLGKLGRETNGIPAILNIFERAHDKTNSRGIYLSKRVTLRRLNLQNQTHELKVENK